MSKIILFGAGVYYQKFKKIYAGDDEIVCMLDNNSRLWGTYVDGILVCDPSEILGKEFAYVVLLSAKAYEMKEQLISLGVVKEKICCFEQYRFWKRGKESRFYPAQNPTDKSDGSKALILSIPLGYDGGSMTAVLAAKSLQERGWIVTLAAQDANPAFIKELEKENLDICLWEGLPYVSEEMRQWTEKFDVVVVNTFPMLVAACEISKSKPVLWWIHECSDRYDVHYGKTQKYFPEYSNLQAVQNIKAVGVSEVAKENFNDYYPKGITSTLPYAILDVWDGNVSKEFEDGICIAVIGNMSQRKAQKLLLEAYGLLPEEEKKKAEIWLIGAERTAYGNEVKELAKDLPQIKILGEKTREEMEQLYRQIDVVVCCSLEETMSLTITEGMMYGKVCLCTTAAGMADYIEDGKNGFLFEVGDARSLADKLHQILCLGKASESIGRNARSTYEENFKLEVLGENLEKLLLEMKGEGV